VHHLKVKVVVIMGHEACGAVKAALNMDTLGPAPEVLRQALLNIKGGLDEAKVKSIQDTRAQDREAVCANIRKQIERIARDKEMMKLVRTEQLLMVGAFYEISSGIVDFFHEVSPTEKLHDQRQNKLIRRPSTGVQSIFEAEFDKDDESGADEPASPRGRGFLV